MRPPLHRPATELRTTDVNSSYTWTKCRVPLFSEFVLHLNGWYAFIGAFSYADGLHVHISAAFRQLGYLCLIHSATAAHLLFSFSCNY